MNQPLVSVVLTSYNQPDLLLRAFKSLISQSYKNIEIIIVDDCSTDENNKKYIEEFIKRNPGKVKVFYQMKNVGIPKNKNTGFRMATGEYITYLDGDDTYYTDKIKNEIETFETYPDVSIVFSNFDIKDLNGKILSIWARDAKPAQGYIFKDILLNNFPDAHTHRYELFKRDVLYDNGFYDEQFSVYHDFDFMLRYSLKYKTAYTNYVGSSYYKNPKSIVSNTKGKKLIEQQQNVYRKYTTEIKNLGLEKEFNIYANQLELNKLFYLDKINYLLLFKAFLKQPRQLFKIGRIANFLIKKKANIG